MPCMTNNAFTTVPRGVDSGGGGGDGGYASPLDLRWGDGVYNHPPGFAGNRDIWIFVGIFKPTSMSKYLKYHVPVLLECENAKIF